MSFNIPKKSTFTRTIVHTSRLISKALGFRDLGRSRKAQQAGRFDIYSEAREHSE
jgi:hypothetical protein